MRKLITTAFALLILAGGAFADGKLGGVTTERAQRPNDLADYIEARASHWCATKEVYEMNALRGGLTPDAAACPSQGTCDAPGTRDATPVTALNINVIFHVIRNDNGTGGISQATVDATIAEMNADYGSNGTGIQFTLVATRYHNNSTLASIAAYSPFNTNYQTDINQMKDLYNENPASNLNIYASAQDNSAFGVLLGIATFPWDANALLARGGLWVNNIAVGTGAGTATHEVGHCLGLWHTHHGVSEVSSCGTCYEYASGVEGSTRGDFCEDTPPTPTNYNCAAPGGSDCQGTSWGATQPQNYMGYGPDNCYTLFTAKQGLRMQCWTKDRLAGWLGGGGTPTAPTAQFSGSPTSGSVPLTVNFTDQSSGSPTSWSWNFGDGGTSTAQNPSHVYSSTGTYTVTLTATNAQGSDGETKTNYITVTTPPVQQCDDFADNNITNWGNSRGTWSASGGIMTGNSNTSYARRTSPFGSWSAPTISVELKMNSGRSQRNARIIWAYVDASNYRFLEADDLNNQWKVVERVGGTNTTRATATGTINTGQWYTVQVAVASNGAISVSIDGTSIGGYAFATAASGLVGVGFNRANSNFDDFCVSGTTSNLFVNDSRDDATDEIAGTEELPTGFALDQNYPNPFNPKTLISFRLGQTAHVNLSIFNLLGEKVATLVDDSRSAGDHLIEWDATGMASGVYFYRLESNGIRETKKMLFLK